MSFLKTEMLAGGRLTTVSQAPLWVFARICVGAGVLLELLFSRERIWVLVTVLLPWNVGKYVFGFLVVDACRCKMYLIDGITLALCALVQTSY